MSKVTGADLIAHFVQKHCFDRVFLVTGGACAFIVDAIARNERLDYIAFQHEQAAAMAADAVWRINKRIGVTLATSGPGATNLVTGIACSWFDSIPTIHITGQVNQRESSSWHGLGVRQAGFQETDIVSMCAPITKMATRVRNTDELSEVLISSLRESLSGRMGPVLIDVPMDVQQENCSSEAVARILNFSLPAKIWSLNRTRPRNDFFENSQRPLVVLGGGLVAAQTIHEAQEWCEEHDLPFCSSWAAMPQVRRSSHLYLGSLGVYGSRLANWAVQSADSILCLGTRLDNRQRTSNPKGFAPFARIHVVDIDGEELKKFERESRYSTEQADLSNLTEILSPFTHVGEKKDWLVAIEDARRKMSTGFESAVEAGELNPYDVVRKVQGCIDDSAIVVSDCGANLCWVYQAFLPSNQMLFTAGGNSPMGYSLPAAIGASLADSQERSVVCFIGDGGLQMNIQELQTIRHYELDIKVIVLNNFGYGIIKQFQDAYFEGRHEASGRGYSLPDFALIAQAYGLRYNRVRSTQDLDHQIFGPGAAIIDVHLPPSALITPKVEMDRFIHDQFPYGTSTSEVKPLFDFPARPSQLD